MNNIPNNSSRPSSYKPPPNQSPSSSPIPLSEEKAQEQGMAYLALQTLANQYSNSDQQNSFKTLKNKELYPRLITNSSGKIVAFVTTLNKEERTDIYKVEKYVSWLLENDSSIDKDKKVILLNHLEVCKQAQEKTLRNKQTNDTIIPAKLEDLKCQVIEGKNEKINTLDGRSYKCTTFNSTKKKVREVRLYEDLDGPFALVYLSNKGTGCNTNGKASQTGGEKIVCRHMSSYYIRHRDEDWREILSDPNKMANNEELDNFVIDVDDFLRQSDRVYMCSPFNIGAALYELSVNSENPRPVALFGTHNHLMAINIEKRKKGGVVLKFYDPNQSDNIVRVILPSVDHLKKLTIDCLLNEQDFKLYFEKYVVENTPAKTTKSEYLKKIFPNKSKQKPKPEHAICAFLASYDDPMKDTTGNYSQDTKVKLLTPEIISNNPELNKQWMIENLQMSMFYNQNNVSDVILKILNSKELTKEEKFLCMKANRLNFKRKLEYPVISSALQHGSTEALKAYMEKVLNYRDFSGEKKYELLGGLENDSCLYFGFTSDDKNCKQVVMAYVQTVIEAPNLPVEYKIKLLRAQRGKLFGLEKCKSDELKDEFINFIKTCNLKQSEKDEILSPH